MLHGHQDMVPKTQLNMKTRFKESEMDDEWHTEVLDGSPSTEIR